MTNWPELPVNSIIVSKLFSSCRCGEMVIFYPCVLLSEVAFASLLLFLLSGDARIANNKVFSFDLVSKDPSVIASCDMSNVSSKS